MSLIETDRLFVAQRADDKVTAQKKLIVTLSPNDPRLPDALSLLAQMRQNASSARFADALWNAMQ